MSRINPERGYITETERISFLEELYDIYRLDHPPMFSDAWNHMQAIGEDIQEYKLTTVRMRMWRYG